MPFGIGLALTLSFRLVGCAPTAPAVNPAELSTPQTALMTYLNAIAQGNDAKARAASIGTEQDKRWIDGMTSLISGVRSYDQALTARFGQKAVTTDIDLKQALSELANEPLVWFRDGLLKEAENTAQIQAAVGHVRLAAVPPVYLKREKDGWKVDLTAARRDSNHSPQQVEQHLAAGKALNDAARQVRTGRYRTFEEALQAAGN